MLCSADAAIQSAIPVDVIIPQAQGPLHGPTDGAHRHILQGTKHARHQASVDELRSSTSVAPLSCAASIIAYMHPDGLCSSTFMLEYAVQGNCNSATACLGCRCIYLRVSHSLAQEHVHTCQQPSFHCLLLCASLQSLGTLAARSPSLPQAPVLTSSSKYLPLQVVPCEPNSHRDLERRQG